MAVHEILRNDARTCIKCGVSKPVYPGFVSRPGATTRLNRCLACRREYTKAWNAKNAERLHEYSRRSNQKARARGYKKPPATAASRTCSDCKVEKPLTQQFFTAGTNGGFSGLCKPCNRERARQWRRAHPQRVSEQISKRKQHPDYLVRAQVAFAARRARKLCTPGKASTADVKRLFNRFDGRCAYCGSLAQHVDHVVPLSRGGSNFIGNMLPACAACNETKHSSLLVEWRYRSRRAA